MKTNTSNKQINRRTFLKSGAILTAGIAGLSLSARAQTNKNSKLRIFQIGVGGIGGMQRANLKDHPMVEFAGFCDVDRRELDNMAQEFPRAFRVTDFRDAFASRIDQFDAVIVDTPDHQHATMILLAMEHGKHVFAQKPLVHQLDELRMIDRAVKARPDLVTQMCNQRSCNPRRMQAVEVLRSNRLGKPIEAWAWTGGVSRSFYFAEPWSEYRPAQPIPDYLNWDLWVGPVAEDLPYSDDLAPARWRTFWETGGGQLNDWGAHLLDVLYYAYDMPAPEAVLTHCIRPAGVGHSAHNQSTITYPGGGAFARDKFVLNYSDSDQGPSFASLGLPPMRFGANHTLVVCEEGTLLVQADGEPTLIFRNGQIAREPWPEVEPRNHWKDWADNCLGAKKPLWSPFEVGWRITEPGMLAVKASRFPGHELRWDSGNSRFTNHEQANREIVSRTYRKGFEPPKVG